MLGKDGKRRFPRLIEDYPKYALGALKTSKMQRYKAMILNGKPPKNYSHLSRRQKRVASRVASGMPIGEVCRKERMSSGTFYHWLHCHPLFQKYYFKKAAQVAGVVDKRLDASIARAVRVIDESLNSGDPYFAHEAAVQLLKGRGKYSQAMNVKKEGNIRHQFEGGIDINQKLTIKDERAVSELVAVMRQMAGGGNEVRPKVIDVEALKELPEAKIPDPILEKGKNAPSQVQARKQA